MDREAPSRLAWKMSSCVFIVQGSKTEGDARHGKLLRSLGPLDHGDTPAPV